MNLNTLRLDHGSDMTLPSSTDGLIASHFDQAFLVFNLFVDDPRTCLELSEAVFRSLSGDTAPSQHVFYRRLVQTVRALPFRNELPDEVGVDSMLCWLLKDAADLTYVEIGTVMELERSQVQERISDVRMAILG